MQIRFATVQDAVALDRLNALFNGHHCSSVNQIAAFLSAPHSEIILLAQQEQLLSIGFVVHNFTTRSVILFQQDLSANYMFFPNIVGRGSPLHC